MLRIPPNAVVKRGKIINVSNTKSDRGKPLIETINRNLSILNLIKHMTFY